jgi:acyl-CoA synthetase (AMP-forming)/AMP-acid ligase II
MLFEALKGAVGSQLSTSGIRHGGKLHPYSELAERAEHLASGLLTIGIGTGDVVAILMRNSPDTFVLLHALLAIGAISVPLGASRCP